MTSPFHAVARGLRLAQIGFLLACWGGTAAFGMFWFIDRVINNSYYRNEEFRWLFLGLFFATLATVLAGVVVGFIGRVRCLRVPEEYPAVRGRLLAAVILEGSGWGSLLVGIGVGIAMGFRWLPDATWVPQLGMVFSGLMVLGGRVMLLRFLRFLARVVEDKPSARRARHSLTLFLADWAAGLVGLGILFFGSAMSMYEVSTPLGYLVWIAAAGSGLYGLLLYDRLLGGLARSVLVFADAHQDDEVEEYRAREERRDVPDEAPG